MMLWVQWTMFCLLLLGSVATVLRDVKRVRGPVTLGEIQPSEAVFCVVLSLLTVLGWLATGAFNKIFGWPA